MGPAELLVEGNDGRWKIPSTVAAACVCVDSFSLVEVVALGRGAGAAFFQAESCRQQLPPLAAICSSASSSSSSKLTG
mgnify:CR=1 FL=1